MSLAGFFREVTYTSVVPRGPATVKE